MSSNKLDKSEKEILEAFESGEFESEISDARRAHLTEAAELTFKKDKRINIRLSSRDLDALQRYALREGVPYQTLVSSILHKFVSGDLVETSANNELKKDARKKRAS